MPWVQVTSGRGPVECAQAAYGISRCIMQEALAAGMSVDIIEEIPGPSAPTALSVVLDIGGQDSADFVKSLEGPMLWICKSSARPHHKRKNWYVGVTGIEEPADDSIDSGDVRYETMCASGPGGQHVNKTESAVRAVHVPTGLCAISRDQRSQHRNRALALKRLMRAVSRVHEQAKMKGIKARWQEHNTLVRGNPVRTYAGEAFTRIE